MSCIGAHYSIEALRDQSVSRQSLHNRVTMVCFPTYSIAERLGRTLSDEDDVRSSA
jgi:hypothetical protein